MSMECGYDMDEHLLLLGYPNSKWEAVKNGFFNILFYPILVLAIFPLTFLIMWTLGFFTAGEGMKCDRCGKIFERRNQTHKFWTYCEKCSNELHDIEWKFLNNYKKLSQNQRKRK